MWYKDFSISHFLLYFQNSCGLGFSVSSVAVLSFSCLDYSYNLMSHLPESVLTPCPSHSLYS